jgi:arginase
VLAPITVHFDLDVLDHSLYDFLLLRDPYAAPGTYDDAAKGRMRFEEVASILNAVGAEADIVGLAITEYLPGAQSSCRGRYRSLAMVGRPERRLLSDAVEKGIERDREW